MSNSEEDDYADGKAAPRQVRMRILEQMAEALDDEAAGLCRRAASYEEEEFLLCREIDERQTEINRLQLKLDSIRSERDGLLEKIEALRREANAMRDQLFSGRGPVVLTQIEGCATTSGGPRTEAWDAETPELDESGEVRSVFFHRMTVR